MVTLLKLAWPYLVGVLLGAGCAWWIASSQGAAALAAEQATHARDNERHANELLSFSQTALDAQQRAIDEHADKARRVAELDAQLTKEKGIHEAQSRRYRDDLATGAQRLRVAVTNCSATSGDSLSGASGTAGVGDGAATYADLDRAVAQRVFAVAADDQHEIDKLKALQGYVCAIRPGTPQC
jgi:prophage endopeptidase